MSFKKMITAQRLFTALKNRRTSSPCTVVESAGAASNTQMAPNKIAPAPGGNGIFRRYLHHHTAEVLSGPRRLLLAGEKLLAAEGKMTVADAKKILRLSQLEAVKLKLRQNEKDCVSYSEFIEICEKECSSKDQGLEFAKILDESGGVIVLGKIVFLRPEKVIQAIQGLLTPTTSPNSDDRSTKALQEMEIQKSTIDEKAELYVRRELRCGLGYLVVQTAVFVRLTFWELSWDVMEPICFYVTSVYFMGGYAFFLRTSKEPSFEGLYKSRLSSRQSRLMKAADFDVERYNKLKRACYSRSLANRM